MMVRTTRFNRLLAATAVAFLLGSSLAPAADDAPHYRRRVAVCVGINSYRDYTPLACAAGDAVEIANTFEQCGFSEVILLTEAEATRRRILDTMEQLAGSLQEDDLVVFFFAGHGIPLKEEQGQGMAYLIPADCEKGKEREAGIAMSALCELAQNLPSRHTLLLIDACYSGMGLNRIATQEQPRESRKLKTRDVQAMIAQKSVQVLTAGGELDRAFESDGHGLFTHHVLNTLDELCSKGRKALLSGKQLAARIAKSVSSETGGWQRPQFGVIGAGDIVLRADPALASAQVSLAM